MKLLRYYFHTLKNPGSNIFVNQGLGIEARFERSKSYWKKHIKFCKEIQERAFLGKQLKSIAVLGAGRLYDVSFDALKDFESIDLLDADPACLPVWKKKLRNLSVREPGFHIEDVTGCFSEWMAKLEVFLQSSIPDASALSEFLSSLEPADYSLPQKAYDAVLSINLLSQILIYWRDEASAMIERFWKLETDERGNFPEPVQSGLRSSLRKLEKQHLNLVSRTAKHTAVIIADVRFHGYRNDTALWDTEEALMQQLPLELSGLGKVHFDSWLWHIAPQGLEQKEYGLMHEVQAYIFKRQERPSG